MQQFGHILFILGILIAFGTGMDIHHPWLPISLALFGIFVGGALLVVALRSLFRYRFGHPMEIAGIKYGKL
ncbi:MAG: hypothetical protein IIA05_10245 [Proteobacteria bacterium]|nr:hypothetical protein [Pseudomonadota bacterium]